MSEFLQPHRLQHTRLPCPSLSPRACSNSLSIELVVPSSHLILCHCLLLPPSVFPSIRVFSNGSILCIRSQSIGVSASDFPMNIQDWSPLVLTGLISLLSKGTLKSLLQHHSSKASILRRPAFLVVQLSHPYVTTGKTIALTIQTFVGKVMSLLFKMLSRLVITFFQGASIF